MRMHLATELALDHQEDQDLSCPAFVYFLDMECLVWCRLWPGLLLATPTVGQTKMVELDILSSF